MLGSGLGQFLHDLAMAWRATSAYPPGHQNAVEALRRAHLSLSQFLSENGGFDLIVARNALIMGTRRYEGTAGERLAELLRKRGAAGIRFEEGVNRSELELLLKGLLVDARRARVAGSLAAELVASGVRGIQVRDLDFSGLALVEGEGDESVLPEAGGLWERLARRLVEGGQVPGERLASWLASGRNSSDLLAALLGRSAVGPDVAAPWSDDALEVALETAAGELVEGVIANAPQGVAALWTILSPALRARLESDVAVALRQQGSGRAALGRWRDVLPAEALAGIEGALGRARPGLSPGAGSIGVTGLARLRDFFARKDLDSSTPLSSDTEAEIEARLGLEPSPRGVGISPALAALREEVALTGPLDRAVLRSFVDLAEQPDLPRAATEGVLRRLELVYRRLLGAGDWNACLGLVQRVKHQALGESSQGEAFADLLERLSGPDSVAPLVAGLRSSQDAPIDQARDLVRALGGGSVRNLVEILSHEEDRIRRHRLLDLLSSLGAAVVKDASALLFDPRWYVVRNMLVLLRRVGDPGSVPAVRRCAEHPDLRVRLEAIRNLFAFDDELPRELLRRAIRNADPRLAEEAIDLAASRGIVEAIDPLLEMLRAWDPFGLRRSRRLKAIRALAEFGEPRILEGLRNLVAPFSIFGVSAEERRVLYQTLDRYPPTARRYFVERGQRSRDPEVRQLSNRLAEKDVRS